MRNYHVVLSTGEERNIRARDVETNRDGSLTFLGEKGEKVIYAAGAWVYVETEQQDDKG